MFSPDVWRREDPQRPVGEGVVVLSLYSLPRQKSSHPEALAFWLSDMGSRSLPDSGIPGIDSWGYRLLAVARPAVSNSPDY